MVKPVWSKYCLFQSLRSGAELSLIMTVQSPACLLINLSTVIRACEVVGTVIFLRSSSECFELKGMAFTLGIIYDWPKSAKM